MSATHTTPASPTALAPDAMADFLRERLGERILETKVAYGQLFVTVTPEAWVEAVRLAKEDESLACTYWEYLDAVDRGEDGFEIVVNVYSIEHRHRVTFKALAAGGRERPTMPTLTGLFRGANWSEREAYDMFGVEFDGHPGLLPRILTVENFEGWPLRKEFLLSSREAKPWPGSKEPVEAGGDAEEAAQEDEPAGGRPEAAEDKAAQAKERAEKARQKAAEMRAKKAAERGEAEAVTPPEQTPEGAAEIAGTPIAKDAAAGAVAGDTAAGASGDEPGADEPVPDPAAEAKAAEGSAPAPSGTPGVESEGRHGGIPETGEQRVPVKPLADDEDTAKDEGTEANRATSSEPPPPPSAGSGTDADDRREGSE